MNTFVSPKSAEKYDGQYLYGPQGSMLFEFYECLGNGTSSSVYRAGDLRDFSFGKDVAIKILRPIQIRNYFQSSLKFSSFLKLIKSGDSVTLDQWKSKSFKRENLSWFYNSNDSRQAFICGIKNPSTDRYVDLSLSDLIRIFGRHQDGLTSEFVVIDGKKIEIPRMPSNYEAFLSESKKNYIEMKLMSATNGHVNIINLLDVFELVHQNYLETFVVLEYASGGALFERIQAEESIVSRENMACFYGNQLLSGISYCHKKGVAHRDLKLDNLLLFDDSDFSALKIADFGLSKRFQDCSDNDKGKISSVFGGSPVLRLNSYVGSPFYVAPEVEAKDPLGYDGSKADMWSVGIIIYAMIAKRFPFSHHYNDCPTYRKYIDWIVFECGDSAKKGDIFLLPSWFFLDPHLSGNCDNLILSLLGRLLHPVPSCRPSAEEALCHPWFNLSCYSSEMKWNEQQIKLCWKEAILKNVKVSSSFLDINVDEKFFPVDISHSNSLSMTNGSGIGSSNSTIKLNSVPPKDTKNKEKNPSSGGTVVDSIEMMKNSYSKLNLK